MSRLVTARPALKATMVAAGDPKQSAKDYLERVAKYVPSEVLGLYLTTTHAVPLIHSTSTQWWWHLFLFIFCLIATPTVLWFQATAREPKRLHQYVATVGFVIWAYTINQDVGIFRGYYDGGISLIAMALFTFISGLLVPTEGQK